MTLELNSSLNCSKHMSLQCELICQARSENNKSGRHRTSSGDTSLFGKQEKNDVCYCESCKHKTARECIELQCSCCVKADQIRLQHEIVPEDDLSDEERERREEEAQE